jgi:putative ABC transport system substrate-binding protein
MSVRRRDLITLLGGAAAAWPLAARAQQAKAPVIGYLTIGSEASSAGSIASFRNGLSSQGFVEGRNVIIESRYAPTGEYDRLLALASDLVRLPVTLLFASGTAGIARAARAATATIPVVFLNGSDPVKVGLVASMNRPGGNATGVTLYMSALVPKRLELLRELVPQARTIAFLVNPSNPVAEGDAEDMENAARSVGQPFTILKASNESQIDAAFATIARDRADALLVEGDQYFATQSDKLVSLAARYRIPASYASRRSPGVGGLMSYGPNLDDSYRQAGVYAGRILKGDKPTDLPVMQPTKIELVINLKTARALGLTIPLTLQYAADEVIE